jgi:hypothetical protein
MIGRSMIVVAAIAVVAACSSNDSSSGSIDTNAWNAITCTTQTNATDPQGGCTRSYSGCSNHHTYGIECAASCTCRIDATATGHSVNVNCGADGLVGLAENCEWRTP